MQNKKPSSQWVRILSRLGLGLLALLAFLVIGIAALLWESPRPPLAADLSTYTTIAQTQFEQKVRDTFPVGSSEDDLIRELSKQGFQPQWRRKDGDNVASAERGKLICRESWNVSWRSDQSGKITKIQGHSRLSCL